MQLPSSYQLICLMLTSEFYCTTHGTQFNSLKNQPRKRSVYVRYHVGITAELGGLLDYQALAASAMAFSAMSATVASVNGFSLRTKLRMR